MKKNRKNGFAHVRLLCLIMIGGLAIAGTQTFFPQMAVKFANDTIVVPSNAQLRATVNQYKNDPHPNVQKLLRETKPAPLMTVEDIDKPFPPGSEPATK